MNLSISTTPCQAWFIISVLLEHLTVCWKDAFSYKLYIQVHISPQAKLYVHRCMFECTQGELYALLYFVQRPIDNMINVYKNITVMQQIFTLILNITYIVYNDSSYYVL